MQESNVNFYTAEITRVAATGYTITNTVDSMSVTIIKYITGNMEDTSKAFEFTLTDEDDIISSFSLKDYTDYQDEGSETVAGLKIGSTVYLTEDSGVYTPTVEYNGTKITADEATGKYKITLVAGAERRSKTKKAAKSG